LTGPLKFRLDAGLRSRIIMYTASAVWLLRCRALPWITSLWYQPKHDAVLLILPIKWG
jgi:hypothetical protein